MEAPNRKSLRVGYAVSPNLCTVILCSKDPISRAILRDELQLGQEHPGPIVKWRHLACVSKKFIRESFASYLSGQDLAGFETLNAHDRQVVDDLVKNKILPASVIRTPRPPIALSTMHLAPAMLNPGLSPPAMNHSSDIWGAPPSSESSPSGMQPAVNPNPPPELQPQISYNATSADAVDNTPRRQALRVAYASSQNLCTVILCSKDLSGTRLIREGELQIGQENPAQIFKWRHLVCVTKKFIREALKGYTSGQDLEGYDDLNVQDKNIVDDLVKHKALPASVAGRSAASPTLTVSSITSDVPLTSTRVPSPSATDLPNNTWGTSPSWDSPPPQVIAPEQVPPVDQAQRGHYDDETQADEEAINLNLTIPSPPSQQDVVVSTPLSLPRREISTPSTPVIKTDMPWQAATPLWDHTPPLSPHSSAFPSEWDTVSQTGSATSDVTQRGKPESSAIALYAFEICAADVKVAVAEARIARAKLNLEQTKKRVLERALLMANAKSGIASREAQWDSELTVSRAEVNVVEAEVAVAEANLKVEVVKRAYLERKFAGDA